MFTRTVSADDLARLKREREAADRRYVEALTALDATVLRMPEMPHPPPPPDEQQIATLTRLSPIREPGDADFGSGWRARLRRFIWRFLRPVLEQQQDFNRALVDHLNRNTAVLHATKQSVASTVTVLAEQLEVIVTFRWQLMAYLQQLTPYIDGKDREAAALQRRITEDNREALLQLDVLDRRTLGLAAGLDGMSDEIQKRAESTIVREERFRRRVEELQTTMGSLRQTCLSLQRELERLAATDAGIVAAPASETSPVTPPAVAPSASAPVDGSTYVGFEDLFRGAREEIEARVNDYVPCFEGTADVLDVGCGRGEFLDLLKARGIGARGLDVNREMVDVCRARGLEATAGDGVGYLAALPDASLGGLFAAQVVEHLQPDYLIRLLGLAYQKLRPGSTIVLETINPACWFAFFDGYIRDITHVQPLHPDTLKYLVLASGFQRAAIRYSAPYPEHARLQAITVPDHVRKLRGTDVLADLALAFNDATDKLNRLLFTYLDYAVIAERV